MKHGIFTLWLTVFLLLTVSCAAPSEKHGATAPAPPEWTVTGSRPDFPADLHINGVGSAEIKYNDTAAAQAAADSRAIAQVAKQIEVVIQQQSSSFEREVSSAAGESLNQKDIWEKTAAYVKVKVEGARIEDRYHDKAGNRIYSFASLDRMARGSSISEQISVLEANAATLIAEAEKSGQSLAGVHRAVAAYGLAFKKLILAVRKNQYLNVIAPELTHRNLSTALSSAQEDATRLMAGFSIQKLEGDHQHGIVGGSLRDPLRVKVLYDNAPAPDVGIRFVWLDGSGNLDRSTRSDKAGIVETSVSNLGPTGKRLNKIKAVINIYPSDPAIQKELESVVAPAYALFTYELPPVEEVRVAVVINEYNLGTQRHASYLENGIVQSLEKLKLQVVRKIPRSSMPDAYDIGGGPGLNKKLQGLAGIADIAIVGEVKATLLDTSAGSGLIFARSRAVVSIFDLSTQERVGGADLSLKEAGPDRDEAGRRSLEKISYQASDAVEAEIERLLFGKQKD